MTSPIINYGIDLGTTEAMIARCVGKEVEVIRSVEGFESTPCAVWIDRQGQLVVGRVAKDWHEREPENAYMEFKRHMGTDHESVFARSGRKMKPEELSAEVLKSLRADVERRNGESISAAVITVPADFDLPQCEATKRAAEMAGIKHCVLLTEPVAAAMAYGLACEKDGTTFLVYDLGLGTFDAAVVQVRNGLPQVVGHGGDNELGSRNLLWAVVEQLFIPLLTRSHSLSDFGRGVPKWRGAISKLWIGAESAMKRLWAQDDTEVVFDFLCNDDAGNPVEFCYSLERTDVERLFEPMILRTVAHCRKVIQSKGISPTKVILVGQATLNPIIREVLRRPDIGLGIPLEFNIDPMTVVARGAAKFAASQRLPEGWVAKPIVGQFTVKLDYETLGPDTDRPVAGTFSAGAGLEKDFTGFTVEFINPDSEPPWRSGKVGLSPEGNFMTVVALEKNKANNVQIELRDATGTLQELTPKTFQLTAKGPGPMQITLPHAVGVALANNEVMEFFQKGATIPVKKRRDLHLGKDCAFWNPEFGLRIPVVEGDRSRADRNRLIGTICIPKSKLSRDLPDGSDIEITIEIDASRLIRIKVFIPELDEEFEDVLKLESPTPDAKQMSERLTKAKERLRATREKADAANDDRAKDAIQRVDSECMVPEAERLTSAAGGDVDAGRQCQNVINSLESALDDAEDALEWPALVAEAEKVLENTRKSVEGSKEATAEDKREFAMLERETREAIEHRMPDLLRRRMDGLNSLLADIELRKTLDDAEESLDWPGLTAEAESTMEVVRDLLKNATSAQKNEFATLERETREAIQHRIPDILLRRLDSLNLLASEVGVHRFVITNRRISPGGVGQIEARLIGPTGKPAHGMAVELVNEDLEPQWSSGWIPVESSGDFAVSVNLNTRRSTNEFRVALRDQQSKPLKVSPGYFVLSIDPTLKRHADLRPESVSNQ
jgi:molecular chaperone DnaK